MSWGKQWLSYLTQKVECVVVGRAGWLLTGHTASPVLFFFLLVAASWTAGSPASTARASVQQDNIGHSCPEPRHKDNNGAPATPRPPPQQVPQSAGGINVYCFLMSSYRSQCKMSKDTKVVVYLWSWSCSVRCSSGRPGQERFHRTGSFGSWEVIREPAPTCRTGSKRAVLPATYLCNNTIITEASPSEQATPRFHTRVSNWHNLTVKTLSIYL